MFFYSAAEPSPGFNFNIAMYGEQEEELEGTELAAEFSFSSLQKFGQEFLKKLRGKKMANKLLQKVFLITLMKSNKVNIPCTNVQHLKRKYECFR